MSRIQCRISLLTNTLTRCLQNDGAYKNARHGEQQLQECYISIHTSAMDHRGNHNGNHFTSPVSDLLRWNSLQLSQGTYQLQYPGHVAIHDWHSLSAR